MKKIIGVLLLLCIVFSVVSCRPEPKITYDENGVGYGIANGKYRHRTTVYGLKFDVSGESAEITIPDEYNGAPVSLFGDDEHNMKYIAYGDGVVSKYCYVPKDADETLTYKLTLNIGKNITIMHVFHRGSDNYFFKRSEDGKLILYRIQIYWNCSEDSEKYVSKNGLLYYRWNYESGNAVPLFDEYMNEIKYGINKK